MNIYKIKSYAKINLSLNITGKKSNLHQIETMVAFVNLYDEIQIKIINSKKNNIYFVGEFSKDISKKNTIYRMLEILEKLKILENVKFEIKVNKKIPNKAGLGGGSMNAASILKFLIEKRFIFLDKKQIMTISRKIGSDVPLGLNLTNSILTSNNEIKYYKKLRTFYTLIVKPDFGCSTKEIFSKVIKFHKSQMKNPNKKMFDLDYLKKLDNNLEEIALSKYSKLKSIKLYLEALNEPVFVRMTGSGSAIVAYFKSKKKCLSAKKMFNKKYKKYWCIASKTI